MILNQDEIKQAILEYANKKYNTICKDSIDFDIDFEVIEKPTAYTENLYKPTTFSKIEIKNISVIIYEI